MKIFLRSPRTVFLSIGLVIVSCFMLAAVGVACLSPAPIAHANGNHPNYHQDDKIQQHYRNDLNHAKTAQEAKAANDKIIKEGFAKRRGNSKETEEYKHEVEHFKDHSPLYHHNGLLITSGSNVEQYAILLGILHSGSAIPVPANVASLQIGDTIAVNFNGQIQKGMFVDLGEQIRLTTPPGQPKLIVPLIDSTPVSTSELPS